MLVRRRGLAARMASRAAATRAEVVITAVSFLVCFIGSSLVVSSGHRSFQTPGRPSSPGLVVLGWWGGWSGDVAPAEQGGAGEQGSGMPPTLGITRPARHRPSGHKLSRPPMPRGLSAHPQRPTRPGPAEANTTATGHVPQHPQARAQENAPAQRGHVSQPGTVPPEPQQHREPLVAAEPGPPRSQRRHERAGRPQPGVPRLPKLAILREPTNHWPAPSGTPYSASLYGHWGLESGHSP